MAAARSGKEEIPPLRRRARSAQPAALPRVPAIEGRCPGSFSSLKDFAYPPIHGSPRGRRTSFLRGKPSQEKIGFEEEEVALERQVRPFPSKGKMQEEEVCDLSF